ncbi:MAG: tyrosine-type recombinase/integrase, partial [Candidatus Omnitrophica bacterium]|nr:tyrosine-type recombinase/integrase [Candidatus Omnitrophota bacterium]
MGEAIEDFINFLAVERGLAANTLAAYRRDLRKYAAFCAARGVSVLALARKKDIADFMYSQKQAKLSAPSICRSLSAIRMFHRFLVRERRTAEDPTLLVDTPKIWKRVPQVMTAAEVSALLQASAGNNCQALRDHAMLELFYASGMRVSELVDLKVEDVNLEAGYLRCTGKGSKQRIVPIGKQARLAVEKYCDRVRPKLAKTPTPHLFLSRLGKKISRQSIWKLV